MARLVITAADTGFFTSSAIGSPMAPNVFLKTYLNADGTIISFDSSEFMTLESLRYSGTEIRVEATLVDVTDSSLGQKTQVVVSAVSFMRLEGGEMVTFGTMSLPEPLTLEATYLSYGVDDTPSWQFDLGTALGDLMNQMDFKFVGGEGDDVFNPHLEQLPFYGKAAIFGWGGDDTLTGTAGSDFISGGEGDDVITDNYGQNELHGGFGNDIIKVGNGSAGSSLYGGAGDDTLISGWGSDTLFGGSGYDKLIGGMGDDKLFGNKGRDTLKGGEGEDLIDGGSGSDSLSGGLGADVFVFRAGEIGRDRITDFEDGVDQIRLYGISGMDDLTFTQKDGEVWITSADMAGQIILEGIDIASLDASDFLFV